GSTIGGVCGAVPVEVADHVGVGLQQREANAGRVEGQVAARARADLQHVAAGLREQRRTYLPREGVAEIRLTLSAEQVVVAPCKGSLAPLRHKLSLLNLLGGGHRFFCGLFSSIIDALAEK